MKGNLCKILLGMIVIVFIFFGKLFNKLEIFNSFVIFFEIFLLLFLNLFIIELSLNLKFLLLLIFCIIEL